MYIAQSTCMFLAHNALHCFNVLLLLHNGPHGSFPPYDFGPLLAQDHTLLPLLVVRISTYFTCPTKLASLHTYHWGPPSFSFVVDGDTWILLSTTTLGAARTVYSFSAWLALGALMVFYKSFLRMSASISSVITNDLDIISNENMFGVTEKSLEELLHVCLLISTRKQYCSALATSHFYVWWRCK